MTRIIPINFISFLIMQSISFGIIAAQDDFAIIAKQRLLQFTLIEADGTRIVLNWEKTEQLLINGNTPVWLARHGASPGQPNIELQSEFISTNIRDILMYRDLSKSSAVVYFDRLKHINGNIGTKYMISGLPLSELQNEHNIDGSRYVIPYENNPQHSRPDFEQLKKHQWPLEKPSKNRVTVLYPEILVLITNDIYGRIKQANPMLALLFIIVQYIVYFNTISMFFDKLSTPRVKIHINIAGIIVEDEPGVYPFTRFSGGAHNRIDVTEALMFYTPQYLKKLQFSDDSFDFFVVSTGYTLDNLIELSAYSTPKFHIFDLRSAQKSSSLPRYLGAITEYHVGHANHIAAAHRIAWLMGIDAIELSKDVAWTDENSHELEVYARDSRNRCFLLNFPRSLRPFNHPAETIRPSTQCTCYRFYPATTELDSVGRAGCNQPLICEHQPTTRDHDSRDLVPKNIPFPIDGTPCGNEKVCWNRHCILLLPWN